MIWIFIFSIFRPPSIVPIEARYVTRAAFMINYTEYHLWHSKMDVLQQLPRTGRLVMHNYYCTVSAYCVCEIVSSITKTRRLRRQVPVHTLRASVMCLLSCRSCAHTKKPHAKSSRAVFRVACDNTKALRMEFFVAQMITNKCQLMRLTCWLAACLRWRRRRRRRRWQRSWMLSARMRINCAVHYIVYYYVHRSVRRRRWRCRAVHSCSVYHLYRQQSIRLYHCVHVHYTVRCADAHRIAHI